MSGLPAQFITRLGRMFDPATVSVIVESCKDRPASLRLNTLKAARPDLLSELAGCGVRLRSLPWYADGFVLEHPSQRELMELPAYAEGRIYLQSLASMIPPVVLDPQPGDSVLDLTAAPGSKTGQMAMMMSCQGRLFVNDSNKVRFFKLRHNLQLLGLLDRNDGFIRLSLDDGCKVCGQWEESFDKILLDAPCSAEARFRINDERSYGYWSEKKIAENEHKQRRLLFSAWHALKPDGVLVYSTCTMAPEENECMIARLMKKYPDSVELLDAHVEGVDRLPAVMQWKGRPLPESVARTLRVRPSDDIESFFVAKLKKHGHVSRE
ncbi:MAG: RsmB/NOP family class I SAM-dependent RNA methyltransferase [Bdellovibrionota bacterium]|nr:MAG: RsmB/NOP family class I SAM-dependent RNA methyltransferase [Bdellovibrionota bacterium]